MSITPSTYGSVLPILQVGKNRKNTRGMQYQTDQELETKGSAG
jgi:hypothetical protein